MANEIIALIENAEKTGEPVLRSLEYNDPNRGFATVKDEFMLGENILVCPIITKGTYEKEITFPRGIWVDSDGNKYEGNTKALVKTPLDKLTWFRREQ